MAFQNPTLTVFGVVQRRPYQVNPSPQPKSLVTVVTAVQTKSIRLLAGAAADASAWSLASLVAPGLPAAQQDISGFFEGARLVGSFQNRVGYLGMRWGAPNADGTGGIPAALFLDGMQASGSITVPYTAGGDVDEPITIHFRALPTLELLRGSGASYAPRGAAPVGTGVELQASADAGATSWTDFHWGDDGAGALTFTPTAGRGTIVGGTSTNPSLTIAPDDPIDTTLDLHALFGGTDDLEVVPGAGPTLAACESGSGDTTPSAVQDTASASVTIDAVTHAGAGGAAAVPIRVEHPGLLRKTDVKVRFRFVHRDGSGEDVSELTYNGAWFFNPPLPAGVAVANTDPEEDDPEVYRPSPIVPTFPTSPASLYDEADEIQELVDWPNLTVTTPGEYEGFFVGVEATTLAGATVNYVDNEVRVDVPLPTDIVLCLDRSGSMNQVADAGTGVTKWEALGSAANLFHTVFREVEGVLGGTVALVNHEGVAYFRAGGATDPVVLNAPPTAGDLASPGAASGGTPLGTGVRSSYEALKGNAGWRSRVICVMTDGKENQGDERIDDIIDGTPPAGLDAIPKPSADLQNGITIHAVTFGEGTDVDESRVQMLADAFSGGLFSTSTYPNPTDPRALTEAFLDVLTQAAPGVGKSDFKTPVASAPTNWATLAANEQARVEGAVTRAVFVLTDDGPATLHREGGGITLTSSGSTSGLRWWVVDDPDVDDYAVEASAGEWFCVYDLALRSEFEVVGTNATGTTLTLRARVTDRGRPVSGADVRVEVTTPAYSVADVLVRDAAIQKAKKKRLGVPGVKRVDADSYSLRHALWTRAKERFGLSLTHVSSGIAMSEVSPGVYETTFHGTSFEGSYRFAFEARGKTLAGDAFERAYSVSRYLEPMPSAELTTLEWNPGPFVEKKRLWNVSVRPTTRTGLPSGPAHQMVLRLKGRKKPVALQDRLDGTYTARVELDPKEVPSAATLVYQGRFDVDLRPRRPTHHGYRVRVVLEAVELKESKDRDEKNELRFAAFVAPEGDGARATRTLLPTIDAVPGQRVEIDVVLYEGIVERRDSLLLVIAGAELDLRERYAQAKLSSLASDPLARYVRRLAPSAPSWAGRYEPRDEKKDPEELEDWRVWYRVEVY